MLPSGLLASHRPLMLVDVNLRLARRMMMQTRIAARESLLFIFGSATILKQG